MKERVCHFVVDFGWFSFGFLSFWSLLLTLFMRPEEASKPWEKIPKNDDTAEKMKFIPKRCQKMNADDTKMVDKPTSRLDEDLMDH